MNNFSDVRSMQQAAAAWRLEGKRIALIPTSGSIHPGHVSLIRLARQHADIIVADLFANHLQFGANENFNGYPKTTEADLKACEDAGADAVFTPPQEEIYPKHYSTYVTEELIAKPLCGVARPAHFRGVTTIMVKLFNIIHPHLIVVGQKDAQMAAVVRKLITDLHYDVAIVIGPTIRDEQGLAYHVKNATLTKLQHTEAASLNQALLRAKEMSDSGVRSVDRVIAEVTHVLRQQRRIRVIYISIVDPNTMETLREIQPGKSLLAIAAWLDEVRLTDNILL